MTIKKGNYLAIELGGFDNRIIYCILNEVLDYASGRPHRLVGYVYIYDNTLLPIGKDLIKNIEIDSNDKIRQCEYYEFAAINDILLKNGLIWNPDKNCLTSVKDYEMLNAYTIRAYLAGSKYISHDRTLLLLKDLKSEFGSEFLEISIIEKGSIEFMCPEILLQANLHCIIKFKLKGSGLIDVYRVVEGLRMNGIELLYLNIKNE